MDRMRHQYRSNTNNNETAQSNYYGPAKRKDKEDFKGSLGFKILNVNDYDVFKNEIEAKEIVMEMYGVEPVKRTYFDGVLDNNFVKVMPLNRVLNKMDIRTRLQKCWRQALIAFTVKAKSKAGEASL